jgi:ArsR family transcriptional regulator, arsenate/arsenite/antimonite-responsive transcriptional repressor
MMANMPTATLPLIDSTATCCSPITAGILDDAAAEQLAHLFKALGDPTRVKLVSLIAAAPDGEACVCDLTAPVGLSQPTVSHHMKTLVDAGLITREQRGKWAYYRIADDAFTAAALALDPRRKVTPAHTCRR